MNRIKKFISKEIEIIEQFELSIKGQLTDGDKVREGVSLRKNYKGYALIAGVCETNRSIGNKFNLQYQNEDIDLTITDGYQSGAEFRIFRFESKSIISLEQQFCREIIPLPTALNLFSIIELETFQHDNTLRRGIIKIDLNGAEFHVFTIAKEDKNYLVIDCLQKYEAKKFSELAWSVTVSISYLIGRLPQGERFLFFYQDKAMDKFSGYSYSTMRKSINTLYHPTNANSYSWITDNDEAERYYGKVKEVSFSNLSALVKLVDENDDIKAMLLLIIEAMGSSLLVMPAGLSVALETLTEYFYKKDENKLNPISDKQVASKIKDELLEVLNKYKHDESIRAFSVLESKIGNLNAPTNSDKLQAPFKQLGIDLTDLDKEVIMYRNDFLHGNINLKADDKKGKKTYSMNLTEISMRLYTLINCVIMKKIGYEGYILNHVKLQEEGMGKKFDEPYYREL